MTWTEAETNTHQDHVIAHVIGATPLGHFVWDETAYVFLDIGFVWNIYLDLEMGLVPQTLAISEFEADDAVKSELRRDIDFVLRGDTENLSRIRCLESSTPIQSVKVYASESGRRLELVCEEGIVFIETSLTTGEVKIN